MYKKKQKKLSHVIYNISITCDNLFFGEKKMDVAQRIIDKDKEKRELWEGEMKKLLPSFWQIERYAGGLSLWIDKDRNKRELLIYNANNDVLYIRPLFDNLGIYEDLRRKEQTNYLVVLLRVYDMYLDGGKYGQ